MTCNTQGAQFTGAFAAYARQTHHERSGWHATCDGRCGNGIQILPSGTSVFSEKRSSVLKKCAMSRIFRDRSEHLQSLQLLPFSHELGASREEHRGRPGNPTYCKTRSCVGTSKLGITNLDEWGIWTKLVKPPPYGAKARHCPQSRARRHRLNLRQVPRPSFSMSPFVNVERYCKQLTLDEVRHLCLLGRRGKNKPISMPRGIH